MYRSSWLRILLALAIVVTPLVSAVAFMPTMAFAEPAAPNADTDDEIILLESTGRIRVDDPRVAPGGQQVVWNSGSDIGWSLIAAGDFNGNGDAEIAAIRGGTLKVFDPWPVSAVLYEYTLSAGRTFRLLATGDFDNDGYDEIAALHTDSGTGVVEGITVFDGGTTGTTWTVFWNAQFGAQWQDISVGDFNNDTYDDLVLVRNVDRRVMVYRGGPTGFTTLATQGEYATDWLAVAGGNITETFAGDEIALEREGENALANGLVLMRVSGTSLIDIGGGANYRYNPDFVSLALGDLNGDGDDEILMLRNPIDDKVSLLMINPAGVAMRAFSQAIGFGTTTWKLVRAGDVDGDGRDEVVVLRGDRYRVYREPELGDAFTDTLGSFLTTAVPSNLPTMAVADVDGSGAPTLSVSPTSLTFDLEYGQPSPTKTVNITNAGAATPIAWQAQVVEGAAWLRINATSGVTPATLGVSIDATGLAPDTYSGKIRISATTAGVAGTPREVTVTLNVTGVRLRVTPISLTFSARYGETPAQQIVSIRSEGGSGVFGWEIYILEGASWLNLSATSGTSPSNLGVSVNTAAAGLGSHIGKFLVSPTDPQVQGAQQVFVYLTVLDPGLVVTPSAITIMQQAGAPVVTKNVSIKRPGGTVSWNAAAFPVESFAGVAEKISAGDVAVTADGLVLGGDLWTPPAWLVFTPTSGATSHDGSSTVTVSIAPATSPGRYRAVIVVVASNASPGVPNRVQYIEVSGVVASHVHMNYLPVVKN